MIKRLLVLLFFIGLGIGNAWSQSSSPTAHSIGFIGGQKNVTTSDGKKIKYIYSGGNVVAIEAYKDLLSGQKDMIAGFPYPVSYFPVVFDQDLFVSKGYFSDYVQLQWNAIAMTSRIKKFKIFRKPLGVEGDSMLVAVVAPDQFTWRDQYAEKGVMYKYTLFAEGLADVLRMPYVNYIESTGFSTATGTVAGRITYAGGTAVEGVTVVAEAEESLGGKSLHLNGTTAYGIIPHNANDKELEISTGFSIQMWVKNEGDTKGVLFSKGDIYELSYDGINLEFNVNGTVLTMPYTQPVDSFFHVTASFDPADSLRLYAYTINNIGKSAAKKSGAAPALNDNNVYLGKSPVSGSYFKGYIDELRLWSKSLTKAEVERDYGRYLVGNEDGMIGYWRLETGVGTQFYDMSRKGFKFYENHGYLFNTEWSTLLPLMSQLGYKGMTDSKGNYTITGFPYKSEGTLYTFTPMLGVHSFDPMQRLKFIGDGESIHNDVDFKDVSSFKVAGNIRYQNSKFPVEGVSFYIDGKVAVDGEGNTILTDRLGQFRIDVPIGPHSIQAKMNFHGFAGEGRFPGKDSKGNIMKFDFQQPLSGLEFIDTTLVKVAGRVVGGPVEGQKALGFGLSKNNLGEAAIYLTSEKGYDLTLKDSTKTYSEKYIKTSAEFTTKNVTVNPDPGTGEYVMYLPPEKYKFTAVTAGDYIFPENSNVSFDLRTALWDKDVKTDTLQKTIKGKSTNQYPPYDPADYDSLYTTASGDTTWTFGKNTFSFQQRQDFIYRVVPTILVENVGTLPQFGEASYVYKNEDLGIEKTIPLISATGEYNFGYPVFFQKKNYSMRISLFEEYLNNKTNKSDKVPVIDGEIEFINNLALNSSKITLPLNEQGRVTYTFETGYPDTNLNPNNPEYSFTKTLNITGISGNNGSIKTIWRESNPFRAIMMGTVPVGNDFVTTGPDQVTTILRDPPGSGSNAFLEKGASFSTSTSYSTSNTFSQEANLTFHFGFAKTEIITGIEFETQNDIAIGLSSEQTWASEGESVTTTTTTKSWSTSGEEDFVGADGDVFVGSSTNIVYGKALDLQLIPSNQCATCGDKEFDGYKLGIKESMRIDQDFATAFMYSQSHIKNRLIPNLKELRNHYLIYSTNPDTIKATSKPLYISLVPPDHEFYGTDNHSQVWGAAAADFYNAGSLGKGPSYKIIYPEKADAFVTDSVFFYNRSIKGWEYWLAENEKQKVNAKLKENISFDAGTSYSETVSTENTDSRSTSFEWMISPSLGFSTGGTVGKAGISFEMGLAYTHSGVDAKGTETTNSNTYGFTLLDTNAGDYMSIDVKTPADGFGPVFYSRAGATSCPYEGEILTEFYQPGKAISDATLQREKCDIDIAQTVRANIPENRMAEFTLYLKNNSETNEDVWYDLTVDDSSNPNGALLEIDGQSIADGRSFFVKAGETLQKTLKVGKGSSTVMNYEDIRLFFGSACDGNVSDEVTFSVFFLPGCSDIAMTAPKNKWVLNTNTRPVETMNITLEKYDLNIGNFKKILFQYKPSGSSDWTTQMIFYNPNLVKEEEYANADEPKAWISGPKINYLWDMSALPDREYDLRAKTICELAPGVEVETPTEVASGIKDVKRPKIFGSPQPADGVLSANDEIILPFDEEIEDGLLTPFNFSVKGVLNNYKIRHDASIAFDGINDYVRIPDGLDLTNRSYTIEFWAKRDRTFKEEVVFSKGYNATEIVELGFDAANHVVINMGGKKLTSSKTIDNTEWNHYALVFNKDKGTVSTFINDMTFFDKATAPGTYEGYGEIRIGKSILDLASFSGNVHDLRVWTKALQIGTVYAQMSQSLLGGEIGLVGYWPMDEAYGNKALDKARFRHAVLHADWSVLPKGKAYAFDGADDYLEINTASTVVISNEMDFTVEFWFNAEEQANTVMFSSGRADGSDLYNTGNWAIGLNNTGHIYVAANGQTVSMSGDNLYTDNNWHHLALSVSRTGNMNLYIDGEQKSSTPVAGYPSLTGTRMWIGARGYKDGSINFTQDQFFKGMLDDVRIWKLARKQKQINLDRMSKLQGNEMGLVAYYPFERFETVSGIKVSKSSLADQWQNPYGTNGGIAKAMGGENFSDNSPNVKEARPVQKVDFDWTVNKDKIIITPSSSMAAVIEKVVLEFTVEGVQDLYENTMASPATWTAFIDRNQVKWSESSLTLEKKLYAPLSFTMDVVNFGGSEQNFSVKNIPAWLSADVKEGVIAPLSSQTITFTVNPGMNTGYYSEDIFLRTDFGFDEKLHIDMRIFDQEPQWSVKPSDYQYSMNVIGRLEINGVVSTDINDKVAVFAGNECRGVANVQYVEEFDQYLVFMDIYSNTLSGENLEFRVWNASEATEHRSVKPSITFASNQLTGTPASPLVIEANDVFVKKFEYAKGWSWVSYNVNSPELADVNSLFKTVNAANKDQIKGQANVDIFTTGYGWTGTVSQNGGLKNGSMYMLKLANGGQIEVVGTPVNADMEIPMQTGWNWIGFNPRFNMEVNESFATFNPTDGDIVKSQFDFAYYDIRKGWIGSMRYMQPGHGYMYFSHKAGKLTYPKVSILSQQRIDEEAIVENDVNGIARKYPLTMSVIAKIEGFTPSSGTSLKGEINGEVRGAVSPIDMADGTPLYFMTIHGENAAGNISFTLEDGDGNVFEVNESLSFTSDQLLGTPDQPIILTLNDQEKGGGFLADAYPNPFDESTTIVIRKIQDIAPKVKVLDLLGRTVSELKVIEDNGQWVAKWKGNDTSGKQSPAGAYLIHITTETGPKTLKVVKGVK